MKNDVDMLLQQALSPDDEPGEFLNQRVLQLAKEKNEMNRNFIRKPLAAVAAVAMMMVCSIGVYAACKYLLPSQVAENMSDTPLMKAFQSEDAIFINETQEFEKYTVALLGIVSGEDLSAYTTWDEQGNISTDKTYVVTAIENTDNTPRPDVSDEAYGTESFYVSPYIQGYSMMEYNVHIFGGGYFEDVVDGIQYRIMECDNIEMFAYKKIYLGVSEGIAPNADAFYMNEETGEITRNEEYEGLNALFVLPIPSSKGDEAAVEAYVKALHNAKQETAVALDTQAGTFLEQIKTWDIEDFQENAMKIYDEELTPDKDGYISYEYQFREHSSEAQMLVSALFPEMKEGLSEYPQVSTDSETMETCYIETFELTENGNILLRVYRYE